jgi:hypothetical protein
MTMLSFLMYSALADACKKRIADIGREVKKHQNKDNRQTITHKIT